MYLLQSCVYCLAILVLLPFGFFRVDLTFFYDYLSSLFFTLIMALQFYAGPPQIWGFFMF